MLNVFTYIAFVYWAVATVHTILPIDVAVCGADPSRGGLNALLRHTFGGAVELDASVWSGFPCSGGLLSKFGFLLQRPAATVTHIMSGGGQHEPFVPILFMTPILFFLLLGLRAAGLGRVLSESVCCTFLKLGIAVGCRGVIILHSLAHPDTQSLYYKRYSKVEFFIVAWTGYIIELPVWHEALVSCGTCATILLMCCLFPGHFLPEVSPWNVAAQAIAATIFAVGHASYQQRRRARERAARAALAARAATSRPASKLLDTPASAPGTATTADEDDASCSKAAPPASTASATADPASCSAAVTVAAEACAATDAADVAADAAACAPPPLPRAPLPPLPSAAAVAGSLGAARRIHALRCRPYVSAARPCRVSVKIQSAHLANLPPHLMQAIRTEVLAGSGWQLVGAYAREGCLELVIDLRPLAPLRAPYGGGGGGDDAADADTDVALDDSRAVSDQDACAAPAPPAAAAAAAAGGEAAAPPALDGRALRTIGQRLVSCLHRSGLVEVGREPSVAFQLDDETTVFAWQEERQAWVETGAAAAAAALPLLQSVFPAAAVWPGAGATLRLRAVLCGPSPEEVLAGGGLVVRSRSGPLLYSVLLVTAAAPPTAPAQGDLSSAAPTTAPAQGDLSSAAPPPPQRPVLQVDLAVHGAPPSGLLRLEARTSKGLLSAPLAVVLDHDAELLAGLAAMAAAVDGGSANALLLDYGAWLDAAAGASATAAAVGAVNARDGGALKPAPAGAEACVAFAPHIDLMAGVCGQEPSLSSDAAACSAHPPVTPLVSEAPMLAIAADLLTAACQHGAASAAVAAVADRLIGMVLSTAAAAGTPPAAALQALLDAVPAPPTHAGALHLACASGSRQVAEVLLRWHQRLLGGVTDPWVARAACGVTPLHVAAALPDGGAVAAWALRRYPAAATAWRTAVADDGLTPAALAARVGGCWRLRLWHANPAVLAARRALSPPEPLARALELLWGFRESSLERRHADTISDQTVLTLALYAIANAVLPPLLSAAKAVPSGGSSRAALAAIVLNVPHTAPLLAWLVSPAAIAAMAGAPSLGRGGAGFASTGHGTVTDLWVDAHGGVGSRGCGAGGLRGVLIAMHVFRAAVKAAAGLSLLPVPVPNDAASFLSRGGDIALEAVARPLLEQIGLPARLLVSLLDAPAQLLLYRGLEAHRPGSFPRPLERLLLYQVMLLATTAAVAATNRVRFLRAERARSAWLAAAAATSAAGEPRLAAAGTGKAASVITDLAGGAAALGSIGAGPSGSAVTAMATRLRAQ